MEIIKTLGYKKNYKMFYNLCIVKKKKKQIV